MKLWPGQDGWDYPFQVDHGALWKHSLDGVGQLASENPDLKFVIEYKPREPRVHMSFDSRGAHAARHREDRPAQCRHPARFRPRPLRRRVAADSAQLAIDYGRLFGMDVNDNSAQLGRRPRRRQPPPDRAVRVLLHAAQEQVGRRLAARPVPVPRGQRRRRQPRHRLPQGGRARRSTSSTSRRCRRRRTTTTHSRHSHLRNEPCSRASDRSISAGRVALWPN